jgi:dolichol-phosphate mannosyltransferase|tara:strand:+ start:742 stop:1440 length:699 start_codon:yes stop_codon:yes gene_type:complete
MDKKISIILSTYNEAPVIEETISEIFNNVKNVEIILVDDNSSDGTLEKVKNINNPNIKIFSRKFRGLASAFLLGLINSSGDIVGWIDSNLKSAAIKLPEMLNHLNNNDIVLLSRYIKGGKDERRKFRIFASKIVNWLCQLILSKEIKDYTSGMFVMKRNVLITITPICYGHGEFFIEFIYRAHKRGLKIFEIPFVQPPDLEKMSKTTSNIFRFFSFGFYYLIAIFHSLTRRN